MKQMELKLKEVAEDPPIVVAKSVREELIERMAALLVAWVEVNDE